MSDRILRALDWLVESTVGVVITAVLVIASIVFVITFPFVGMAGAWVALVVFIIASVAVVWGIYSDTSGDVLAFLAGSLMLVFFLILVPFGTWVKVGNANRAEWRMAMTSSPAEFDEIGEQLVPEDLTDIESEKDVLLPSACQNHGSVAWSRDNMIDGTPHGEDPIGGFEEPCWVVAQTWWYDSAGVAHRAMFAVPPHTVVWISGHQGGTGWYFQGDEVAVRANLAEQARQVAERDGEMDTIIVVLPADAGKFPIYARHRVAGDPIP